MFCIVLYCIVVIFVVVSDVVVVVVVVVVEQQLQWQNFMQKVFLCFHICFL